MGTKEELEKELKNITQKYQQAFQMQQQLTGTVTKLAGIIEYLQEQLKKLDKPKEEKK